MKIKGSYRYFASITSAEIEIIKNALEALLEAYEDEPYFELSYRKGLQKKESVDHLLYEFNNIGIQ
jgi:hypothetical protein